MDTTTRGGRPGMRLRQRQGAAWDVAMRRVINPLMRRMLSGRLHRLMGSDTLMVLTFQGRTSGRRYSFPIGYLQEGRELVSYTPFRWWVNLRDGAPVRVTLRGRELRGTADVCTDPMVVRAGMEAYLRHNPGDARFWKVRLDADKRPDPGDVARVAPDNAQVRVTLLEDAPSG